MAPGCGSRQDLHFQESGVRGQESGVRGQESDAGSADSCLLTPDPLLLYISSTGVYGDADGEWVDETTPCRPAREGGKACLAAEQVLAEHPLGKRSVVLRPAGIYGPDRIIRAEALRRGEPIDAPADGYLNLIHVDDLDRRGDGRSQELGKLLLQLLAQAAFGPRVDGPLGHGRGHGGQP